MRQGALLVLVLGLWSAPVGAQPDELAKSHYLAGQAYYNQARYAEAAREFREAFRLSPKPGLLYNIAQACERMGKIDEAIDYLRKYLAAAPDASDKTAVEERLKTLEARIRQTAVAIACEVAGATVLVDGKELGRTPLAGPLPVSPGSHELRVVKEGHEPFSAFVSVNAGQTLAVTATLPPRGSKRRHLWPWILGGTAAALLVTGAVTGGMALSKAGAAQTRDGSDADKARTLAVVSDVTIGVGAAAAVAATILFFVERRREAPAAAVAPLLGPTTAGISARVQF